MPESFEHLFDKARRAFVEGYPEHALVPATEAVKLAPERWDARLLLARIWLAQGGTARAAADARAAIDLARGAMPEESLTQAKEILSLAALASKDFEAAEKELRDLALGGHVPSVVRLAGVLVDRERHEDARTLASDCASRHPKLEEALAAAALALADADAAAAQRAVAELALAAGMKEDARERFQRVLASDPEDAAAIDGLQRASGSVSEPSAAPQSDLAAFLRWGSSVFVALGIALTVFSVWRREAIATYSRFPPEWWMGAGRASLAFGIVLMASSRSADPR